MICDASAPTYLLAHFVRDRARGERIGLEQAVRMQTRDTAELYGFLDRGLIEPGMRADINLIDFDKLSLPLPEMVYDLPAGGKRLIQKAHGYRYTICSGQVTYENGEHTEAFLSYIAGLQHYTPELISFYAPNVNSYRRLAPDISAPINLNWGL